MAGSMKPAGRLDFVLRILLVTALGFAFELLLRSDALLHLSSSSHHLSVLLQATVFCMVGAYSANAIDWRLLDSGFPRWQRYPAYAVWLLSTSLPFIRAREWPVALALFLLLLISGGVIPSKRVSARIPKDVGEARAPQRSIPTRFLISPVGFLRSLLTLACISLPLIWVESAFGRGIGSLTAHLGYGILYLVWVFKVLGRFADSGRSSNWFWFPFCIAVTIGSVVPTWFKFINHYETLAVFLLIQIPLALLPSIPAPDEPVRPLSAGEKYRERVAQRRKDAKPFVVEPFAFLIRLLVIAGVWALLVLMNTSGGPSLVWVARGGYFILAFAWIMNATGRLEDAGWAHSWYPSQYCLAVSVTSLMPLAVRWVNGYEALAIFVLVQVPTVFLKSKPKPEDDPLPQSTSSDATPLSLS